LTHSSFFAVLAVLMGGSASHIDTRPAVVFLGDSITEEGSSVDNGFVLRVSPQFTRRADVLNRGLCGYNTKWMLKVFDRAWPPHDTTALAVLWFGNNDMADKELGTPLRHVPLEAFKANLASIIARSQGKCSRVVVISPVPIHEGNYRAEWPDCPLDRTLVMSGKYAAAAKEAASEAGVPYLDLWQKFQDMTFDSPAQRTTGDEQNKAAAAKDEAPPSSPERDRPAAEAESSSPIGDFFRRLSGDFSSDGAGEAASAAAAAKQAAAPDVLAAAAPATSEDESRPHQPWGRLLRDGLHLSEEGHKVVAQEFLDFIKWQYPKFLEWEGGDLQMHLPSCGAVTPENEDAIFGADAPAAAEEVPAAVAEAPAAAQPGAEAGGESQ